VQAERVRFRDGALHKSLPKNPNTSGLWLKPEGR